MIIPDSSPVVPQVTTLTDGALSLSSGVTANISQPNPPKAEETAQQDTSQYHITAIRLLHLCQAEHSCLLYKCCVSLAEDIITLM